MTHVTDPDENVVESYDYGPYGEIEVSDQGGSTVSGSQIGNPFTYTGRRLDEETGLYYYRARHYDPVAKRFIQRDPLEYVDGPNARGYVSCRSTCARDPLGLEDQGTAPNGATVHIIYYDEGETDQESAKSAGAAIDKFNAGEDDKDEPGGGSGGASGSSSDGWIQ